MTDPASRLTRQERLVALAYIGLLALGLLHLVLRPFRSGVFWMNYMSDDFFFYLKIAQNVAAGRGSTFNGLVPTNGYHPLYEGLLVLLSFATSSPHAILAFEATLIFAAALATLACSFALLRRSGLGALPSLALGGGLMLYAVRMFLYGMEVTLTIPLALLTILVLLTPGFWQRGFLPALALGLLMALTVLSRLDAFLLVTMLLAGAFLTREIRSGMRAPVRLGVAIGLLPLLAYFVLNHHVFGTWLPVSGMAKQLKPDLRPTAVTWQYLHWNQPSFAVVMLPIPLALIVLWWRRQQFSPFALAVYTATLCFPWVYYLILCCRSDWQLFGWYLYALRPAECVALVILATLPAVKRTLNTTPVAAVLLLGVLAALAFMQWRLQYPELYAASLEIQTFEHTHPGIYAMGDRSGSVGYLIHSPLVQTEGLVMDKAFLENVRRERPLLEVLHDYGVHYYVVSPLTSTSVAGCLDVVEPYQGGPASPKMRAKFCRPPALLLDHGIKTYIFDLAQKP